MTEAQKKHWESWRRTLDEYEENNSHTEMQEIVAGLLAEEADKTEEPEINMFRVLAVAFEEMRKELWRVRKGYGGKERKVRDAMVETLENAARDYFPEIAAILYGEE